MRRASAVHNPGVSLFPFLAVLICTMGVMMLLLVIINRPAPPRSTIPRRRPTPCSKKGARDRPPRLPAATAAHRRPRTMNCSRRARCSIGEFRNWKSSREKTIGDLRNERLRLSTVEDGMRKLRDQWAASQKSSRRHRASRQGEGSRQAVDRRVRRSAQIGSERDARADRQSDRKRPAANRRLLRLFPTTAPTARGGSRSTSNAATTRSSCSPKGSS